MKKTWKLYYTPTDFIPAKRAGLGCAVLGNETCSAADERKSPPAPRPIFYNGCGPLKPYEGTPATTWPDF